MVNVASECGYTETNYRELVRLQEDYRHHGVNVLAFPCNQFGEQEPGADDQIRQFAKAKYDVNFPMFSKVDVHGEGVSPIFRFLGTSTGRIPGWNFCKYLVDGNGVVKKFFRANESFDIIRQAMDHLILLHDRTEL